MLASKIAQALGGRLILEDVELLRIAPLFSAGPFDLSVIMWPKDIRLAKKSQAGAVLIDLAMASEFASQIPMPMIVIEDFLKAFFILKELFKPKSLEKYIKSSLINKSAQIGRSVIEENTFIGPHVFIGDNVIIQKNCIINAGVVIHDDVFIGEHTVIKANTVIGSESFVPYQDPAQNLLSLGSVIIESHVRIGALCTIDQGVLGATLIKKTALIDNMVHIGHDSIVGQNTIIAGQTGLAGFVRLGDKVTLGGQVGIAPHVVVGDGARISGKSMVHCDIGPKEIWSGNPSVPHGLYLRSYGRLMKEGRKKGFL
jgi:UDP-3-O-[3-hydroxymyristoyl] glucosamine N-acyltransferase